MSLRPPGLHRPAAILAAIAAVAALVCVVGAIRSPAVLFPIYLSAVLATATIPLGCLAVFMIASLVGGRWAAAIEEPLRLGMRGTLPAAILLLPVLIGIEWIYPWAREPVQAAGPAFRRVWLSEPAFIARTIAYLAVFVFLAAALSQAITAEARRRLAIPGLIVGMLVASFAGIDWGMSVEPKFHSSIYGLVFVGELLLSGLSFAILTAVMAGGEVRPTALGALLVSAILLWAYLHAMQYVVMWSADIPVEAAWYLERVQGPWLGVLLLVALIGGAGPLLVLLFRAARRSGAALAVIAAASLLVRWLETAWLVLPPFRLESGAVAVFAIASGSMAVCALGAATLSLGGGRAAEDEAAGAANVQPS